MVGKKQAEYIKLKSPEAVMAYCQRLINRIRREDLELDPNYIGKIIYILNTWLNSYKLHVEFTELQQIKEDLARLEAEVKGRRK